MLKLVQTNTDAVDDTGELEATGTVNLDELCRMAAQQMLATALAIRN